MPPVISYAFTPISGYAYLGHDRFREIAHAAAAHVDFRPFDVAAVFGATGTTPPAKQSAARRTYRQADMVRSARREGLPLNATPKFWPADATLAARTIIATEPTGDDPWQVTGAIFAGVWAKDRNIAEPADLESLLDTAGVNAKALIDRAAGEDIAARYAANTHWAIETGIFGSPTYILDGELFWGQDRLDLLAETLAAPRATTSSPATHISGPSP